MSKVAIIYWSGTGNTEMMANSIKEGAEGAGAEVVVMTPDAVELGADFTAVALGCPSMGSEVLEESEFEPMWQDLKGSLSDKKVGLFGSYGWGDGEWMRNWVDDAESAGIKVVDSITCQEAPDDDVQEQLKGLGKSLA